MPPVKKSETHSELLSSRDGIETIELIRLDGSPESTETLIAALRARIIEPVAALPILPSAHPIPMRKAIKSSPPPPSMTAVIVPTSGSTGSPKFTCLTRTALVSSIEATATRLGGNGSWLLALPATHIAGVQVILRALHGGGTIESMDLRPTFTAGLFADAARRLFARTPTGRHYTSLVPTQLRRILYDDSGPAAIDALRTFDAVLVGGAHLDLALAEQARHQGVTIVTTYGMSETAGGCVYDGQPLDGVDIQIVEPDQSGVGRVQIHGPMLALGYLDGAPGFTGTQKRWFTTSDLGRISESVGLDQRSRLAVLGRYDDLIVSGGAKIAPAAVESIVSELNEVAEVLAVGVADPEWGQALTVCLTLTNPPDDETVLFEAPAELAGKVRAALRSSLGHKASPKAIYVTAELPLLASGKPDRRALRVLIEQAISRL